MMQFSRKKFFRYLISGMPPSDHGYKMCLLCRHTFFKRAGAHPFTPPRSLYVWLWMQVNVNFDLTLPLVAPEVEEWHHDVSLTGFASFPYRSVVEVLFQVISDLLLHLSIKGNLHEWISTTIHLAWQFFSKFFVAINIICICNTNSVLTLLGPLVCLLK